MPLSRLGFSALHTMKYERRHQPHQEKNNIFKQSKRRTTRNHYHCSYSPGSCSRLQSQGFHEPCPAVLGDQRHGCFVDDDAPRPGSTTADRGVKSMEVCLKSASHQHDEADTTTQWIQMDTVCNFSLYISRSSSTVCRHIKPAETCEQRAPFGHANPHTHMCAWTL